MFTIFSQCFFMQDSIYTVSMDIFTEHISAQYLVSTQYLQCNYTVSSVRGCVSPAGLRQTASTLCSLPGLRQLRVSSPHLPPHSGTWHVTTVWHVSRGTWMIVSSRYYLTLARWKGKDHIRSRPGPSDHATTYTVQTTNTSSIYSGPVLVLGDRCCVESYLNAGDDRKGSNIH